MSISMHSMSHAVFKKALTQLLFLMEKGAANAKARNFGRIVKLAETLSQQ